jgi:small subunit ribosomal protein S20
MAHIRSAKKRIRQIEKRTVRNRARKSRINSVIRQAEEAIASGDKARAQDALRAAQPEIMHGVTKGVLHRNKASRKISRLSRRVKALGAPATS